MSINCRICKKEVPMTVGVCIPCSKENARLREALKYIRNDMLDKDGLWTPTDSSIWRRVQQALEAGDE